MVKRVISDNVTKNTTMGIVNNWLLTSPRPMWAKGDYKYLCEDFRENFSWCEEWAHDRVLLYYYILLKIKYRIQFSQRPTLWSIAIDFHENVFHSHCYHYTYFPFIQIQILASHMFMFTFRRYRDPFVLTVEQICGLYVKLTRDGFTLMLQ